MEYLDFGEGDRVFQAVHGPFVKHSEALEASMILERNTKPRRHCVVSLMSHPDNI
jgi:hypothetical protein